MLARFPVLFTARKFLNCDIYLQAPRLGVDGDDVTILDEPDRPAQLRFRSHMTDAEATRGAREAAIGDQRHLVPHALPVKSSRRRQHLAHARPAARSLIADDQDIAFLVPAVAYRLETGLFGVEAARRT